MLQMWDHADACVSVDKEAVTNKKASLDMPRMLTPE